MEKKHSRKKKFGILLMVAFVALDGCLIYLREHKSEEDIRRAEVIKSVEEGYSDVATTDVLDDNPDNFICDQSNEYDELFTKDYDGLVIVGYKGSSSNIVIPDEIDGQPVVGILGEAFRRRGIMHVKLPAGIKYIDGRAFSCNPLQKIDFPEGLEVIGWEAFTYTDLREVTLPKSLITLGWHSFSDCYNLSEVTIESDNFIVEGYIFYADCKLQQLPQCSSDIKWRKSDFALTAIPAEEYEKVCID